VPKRTVGTSRSPGRQPQAAPPPLPDLTGVSLRTLRTCDDPAVTAAVESTLRTSRELSRMWRSDGTNGGGGVLPSGPGRAEGRRACGKQYAFRSFSGPGGAVGPSPVPGLGAADPPEPV